MNWLSKQAIDDWSSMANKCRPTSIRIYTVDEVHTGSKPIGVVNLTIKWADTSMTLSFIVMDDSSKKVIFGTPVVSNHIGLIDLRLMSMRTYSGHNVPFSELKDGNRPIPKVCSIKIGAEVKWVVSSNSIVVPGEPNIITLEPDATALDFVPARILFDTKFVKPIVGKGVVIYLESIACDRGRFIAQAAATTAAAKEVVEGTVLLRSTILPDELAAL